jgi:type VII secretion-associated serine protease mycosin
VAVVDGGVDAHHPDLQGSVLPGVDLVNPSLSANGEADDNGHGTGMAGLIVAHGQSRGIAPAAKILPVRAFSADTSISEPQIPAGINWAIDHGASIINISASGGPDRAALREAIDRALANNIVVVAAVGNTPTDKAVDYPAAYPGVVAVAGVDREGNHAATSVTGPAVVIAAPAVDIYSTSINGGYRTGVGTSDATAIVSGVVALIRSKYPNLSARDVIHRLVATADDRGPPGRDDQYGYGIVDPVKALTADVPLLPPTLPPTTPEAAPTKEQNSTNWTPIVLIGLAALLVVLLVAAAVAGRRRRPPAELGQSRSAMGDLN